MLKLFRFFTLTTVAWLCVAQLSAQQKADSTRNDSLRYPIKDRHADPFSQRSNNPFDIRDTSLIKRDIRYDPKTKEFYIVERIGNSYYRVPTSLSFDEMMRLQGRQSEIDYFRQRSQTLSALNRKAVKPKLQVFDKLFDRIFGIGPNGLKVDIKPQGSVDIMAGYQGQNVKNPTLPERARRNGGFDFDMNANVNVMGNIGDKLKLPINYNTLANFDFDNQLKLDYKGMDDEIIKSLEAGNVSFTSKGTLIPSAQSLFGIKSQLQFGKLFVTGVLANQRAQRQSMPLQGGAATTRFEKKLDDYEENRHFLLGQYFKNNFNKSMKNLPVVNSQVQILRVEVWVTNRTGATTDARDVVGLMDLGERNTYNPVNVPLTNSDFPQNGANNLYSFLVSDPNNRNPSQITSRLLAHGLKPVEDYEKTFARKLTTNEYYFNQQIGFVSLNQPLQPDEVLGIAYQYTVNGKVFQVGEFSQDIGLDSNSQGVQKVQFLKLLKATSQRPNLPIWDLMMKNVYSLDVPGIQRQDFKLNVLYEEPSGGLKRFLPETAASVEGLSLLRILNLDRLNNQNDPQPDGVFDYVEGYTILAQQGKIIFPVLEPFGRDLDTLAFPGLSQALKKKYVYYQLYDSIKAIAQTYANLNRFVMQGQVKGSSSSEIYLGAFNVPPGSVSVTAGGQILREGADYIIDYNLGTVKILNQAILNAGLPVNVQFENNAGFGIQQRNFLGLRVDYLANKKLTLGGTMARLGERPFFTKMNYGEDPIRNTMYGLDFNYRSDLPKLTKMLDKLPFYSTTAMSNINAYGEAAYLKPGHPKQIGDGSDGLIYIDDFEGTRNSIDLRFPFVSWTMASTPSRFPESTLNDSVAYNYNRAKLAWYNIEPILQDKNSASNPLRRDVAALSDPRTRAVTNAELFPQRTTDLGQNQLVTFDLAYYPTELGPYNFEYRPGQIDANGKLTNPRQRWAGIMRNIDQTDFETGNVEFIEMWVQDPFIKKPTSTGGKLYINLGNISEDVLKDGRRFYENGLNTPNVPAAVDSSTKWGKTPVNPIQITQAFSNDPADRPYQDVGFDGLTDDEEFRKRNKYITDLRNNFGANSPIAQRAAIDPSNDNYRWYRDEVYDASRTDILGRYKNFNNPQGNSPVSTTSSQFSPAATLYPDNEDLNRDNTLNETEEYYEYALDLKPNMSVGTTKYLTDRQNLTVRYADGTTGPETWYLFRVPIRDYVQKVGNIPDFKSIRFMRMYLSDFEDSVVMRFARLDLVRNQWRRFQFELDTTGSYTPLVNTSTIFNVLAVNIEENSKRQPVNYLIPQGIERVQQLSNNNINILQNEQAMSLQVRDLANGDARGVFKTFNLDMRQYGKLSMFVHAESIIGQRVVADGDLNAVIRIGQDFLNNYYEVKVPLKVTPPKQYAKGEEEKVWPPENNLDFDLQDLIQIKTRRNKMNPMPLGIYREQIDNKTISVYGNPNLGEVRSMLVGVENPYEPDGLPIDAEVWINELRFSRLDEEGGYAAIGRMDIQLADLGNISVSVNTYSKGFGTLEQRVNERARENFMQFDAAATIDAGKLLPKKAGITIPVYASINQTVKTPEYDPYDLDIKLKDKLSSATVKAQKDSIKQVAIDKTTVKTVNFTNVRVGNGSGKPKLWKLSNFDFSYSYIKTSNNGPLVIQNDVTKHRGGLGYNFNAQPKYWEPAKKLIKSRSPWFSLIKDFNLNPSPSLLSFRADVNRQFGQYIPRIVNSFDNKVERVDTTYDKYFTFDRYYNLRWDLSRSLNLDFSATNNARVDEPYGMINTKAKRDTINKNFWNGGRNTLYNQKAILSYNLPTAKFPLTDWITARYSYTTTYNWIGASRLAIDLGNTIENSQENNLNGEFDFTRLYQKSRWLRALDEAPAPKAPKDDAKEDDKKDKKSKNSKGAPKLSGSRMPEMSEQPKSDIKTKAEVTKGLTGKKRKAALKKWRQQKRAERKAKRLAKANQPVQMSGVARAGGRLLTSVKRVSINYSENYRSRLPGYIDSTRILGQNWNSMAPGMDYVFGKQPDTSWLNKKAAQGLITRDSTFNFMFRQNFDQRLSITAQLEPIKELTIDLNLDKSFSKEYTELFKDTGVTGKFNHLSPLASGGFNVSYIAFKTLFGKADPTQVSATFKEFENNRIILSERLAKSNPYQAGLGQNADGFYKGYGRYAQDVLIPSFIAAYTGKNPQTVGLIQQSNPDVKANPFKSIKPLPNWRLTYTGLTRNQSIAKTFSTISITHAYTGSLSMNSYNSALLYQDPFAFNAPGFVDTVSGNFIPYFLVPNLSIQEQFAPLIGFDITTTDQLNVKFEYKKSRQLSLSLVDYQLSEVRSTEWTIGAGWRKRGFNPGFKLPFAKNKKLENDINFRLDLSMRDDANSNSRLDQQNAYSTGGQKVISINPSIDYVINNRINIKLFFDQRRVIPYISTSAPITNTRAGLQIRISLAQQ